MQESICLYAIYQVKCMLIDCTKLSIKKTRKTILINAHRKIKYLILYNKTHGIIRMKRTRRNSYFMSCIFHTHSLTFDVMLSLIKHITKTFIITSHRRRHRHCACGSLSSRIQIYIQSFHYP